MLQTNECLLYRPLQRSILVIQIDYVMKVTWVEDDTKGGGGGGGGGGGEGGRGGAG